jgi:hypothetical protein
MRYHVHDASTADGAVGSRFPMRVNVTMEHELRLELFDESMESRKATVWPVILVAAVQRG